MTAVASSERPLLHRVLQNAGVLLGGRAANAVISLGYMAVAARLLGVREVGVLILINAFAQLVGEVVKFNSWQTVLHFGSGPLAAGERDKVQQVVRFTLFLDVASSLVGVAIAVTAALLFGERLGWSPADSPKAALYCLTILVMASATPIGLLRLFDRFDLIAAQAPISSLVRLVGSGLAFLFAATLSAFLVVWAAGTVVAFVYLAGSAIAEMRRRNLLAGFRWFGTPLTAGMPKAWRFAWATNFNSSLDVAFTHTITIVVGALAGPAPAALWRIGRQVADALAKPARLLIPALYPELARLHVSHGEHAMRRLALQVGVVGGGVGTALLLITVLVGKPLLTLVMGPAFAPAAAIMVWQVAAAVIGIWALPLDPMLVTLGRPGDSLKVRLVVAGALLAALPFMIDRFGITGAGASLVAAMAALAAGMLFMLRRQSGAGRLTAEQEMACAEPPLRAKGGEVMILPTAADRAIRLADFATLTEALDFAAGGETGVTVHSLRGEVAEALSYSRLREEALVLAGRLLATGLAPGERVGLVAETDADFVRGFFACQYAGLVPATLPLPAPLGGREAYVAQVGRMLQSADAAALLGPATIAAWFAEAPPTALRFIGSLADLPEPAGAALPVIGEDDPCYLQFSSGSTRFPTGVLVTHRALMANAQAIIRHGLQVKPADRAISWLPLFHDMGLVGFVLSPLCCQMSVDLLPTGAFVRRPLLWLDLIGRNGATISYSPTFGFELCARRAEAAGVEGLDLSGWRIAGLGGDMIRTGPLLEFAKRFAPAGFSDKAFVASYGMAEATLALTMAPLGKGLGVETLDISRLERENLAVAAPNAERARDFARCGPALPEHKLEVRGEDGAVLPERGVGRIFASGPSLMKGYFRQPEETARVLSADGWLDTGDIGFLDGGEIVLTGRSKDLMIVNGRNIWPQDLEWTLEAELAAVRSGDVAAFSVPGEEDEQVVVLVQTRSSDPAVREALRTEVEAVLRQRHSVEALVRLVGAHALPQTSSGKLSRSKARAAYLAGAYELERAGA